MTYEKVPLASPERYRKRLVTGGMAGFGMIAVSLAVGIAGYMLTEELSFIDAYVNAAMILSGMGPLHAPGTTAGKIFAGTYAIYCGIAVLGIAAVVLAPVVHRLFHRFHIHDAAEEVPPKPARKGTRKR
jgi:NhaP-type Na+/H+ or K+/H+ antiporter